MISCDWPGARKTPTRCSSAAAWPWKATPSSGLLVKNTIDAIELPVLDLQSLEPAKILQRLHDRLVGRRTSAVSRPRP